jgi:hypothetical protein
MKQGHAVHAAAAIGPGRGSIWNLPMAASRHGG